LLQIQHSPEKNAMKILIRWIVSILLAASGLACVPTGEGEWVPAPIGGDGGGGSVPAPQPAQPAPKQTPKVPPIQPTVQPTIAPTMMPIDAEDMNIPGVREVHAVANKEDCQAMAKRFGQQGRDLKLTKVKPNGGTVLPFTCVFDGPDAAASVFDDNRSR
jgi:hypothetical protein